MISAGVTAFRLNTSHLSLPQLHRWLDKIGRFLSSTDLKPPLVLDLWGSKWRLGHFASFKLTPGQRIELICGPSTDRQNVLPIPHADFFQAASTSSREIVLNDAKIHLVIEGATSDSLTARVTRGGEISARKGITYTSSGYRQETLNEKDQEVLAQTQHLDFIRYAISYLKDSAEMARYRALLGHSTYLIAKLERKTALEEAIQITESADELWLCRGDLGAELGFRAMAKTAHRFSEQVGGLSLPVLMAGQVLEYMAKNPIPTRSEVCYLYDTLRKGYQGFVLSDETAVGQYPIESCRMAALFQT
jgi:pyruvate kinase